MKQVILDPGQGPLPLLEVIYLAILTLANIATSRGQLSSLIGLSFVLVGQGSYIRQCVTSDGDLNPVRFLGLEACLVTEARQEGGEEPLKQTDDSYIVASNDN